MSVRLLNNGKAGLPVRASQAGCRPNVILGGLVAAPVPLDEHRQLSLLFWIRQDRKPVQCLWHRMYHYSCSSEHEDGASRVLKKSVSFHGP